MAKRGVPKKMGHRPRMTKLYDGRNVATRPIPLIEDTSDRRASEAAAADQQHKHKATKMPSGPRVGGVDAVFGKKVGSGPGSRGATFNPATGLEKTI